MTFPYPTAEAAARLHGLGEKAISAFLDEVSPGSIRNLVSFLPFVPGFRKTSQAGIQQQKRALARRLCALTKDNTSALHKREYDALFAIWRTWGLERLGVAEEIEEYLDKIEEIEDQRGQVKDRSLADNNGVEKLFLRLRDLSHENKCSREQIERFLAFSPFSRTELISRAIAESKSATDVERDAAFKDIPERLQRVEQDIQSFKGQTRSIIARIDALPDLSALVRAQAARLDKLVEAQNALIKSTARYDDTLKGLATANNTVKKSLEAQASEITKAASQLTEVLHHHDELRATTPESLARVASEVQSLAVSVQALACKIPTEEWRAGIEATVASALEDVGTADQLAEEWRAGIESKVAVAVEHLGTVTQRTSGTAEHHLSRLTIVRLLGHGEAAIRKLDSLRAASSVVSANLQTIGLKNTAADIFADEICAATIAAQVVFFGGSFSTDVARLCAIAFSAGNAFRTCIPIGLDDGEELRRTVLEAPGASEGLIPSVVMEGINRSAIELFEDVLTEISCGFKVSPYRDRRRAFIFASLLRGPAALPAEINHLQLGPIFDLDYLDWRPRASDVNLASLGAIGAKDLEPLRAAAARTTTDEDEIMRLIRKGATKRNPALERSVLSAYRALKSVNRATPRPTPLQSLAYGWLAPLWLSQGLASEEIDSELDGGKVDAEVADSRLADILNAIKADGMRARKRL